MRGWGQRPIFMIRPGDDALDASLAALGYAIETPTLILAAPAALLAPDTPDERAILCDAPLARMREIWQAGGIGATRLAVMARACEPKAYLLGRAGDAPAACAFLGCDGDIGMLHALEVAPGFRRQGLGTALTRAGAAWAVRHGATTYALDVTASNAPARMATRLGMEQWRPTITRPRRERSALAAGRQARSCRSRGPRSRLRRPLADRRRPAARPAPLKRSARKSTKARSFGCWNRPSG